MSRPTLLISLALVATVLCAAVAFTKGPAPSAAGFETVAPGQSRAYLHSFNVPGHGVAIEGYSPVSYFEGRAELGSALFAVEHRGVTYHLTSADQVDQFKKSPDRFEPAFGGWCAFGMSVQDKFPVDPTCFRIVGGRLLLFLRNESIDAGELWEQGSEAELLEKATAHWKKVRG
ncbi:MAG: YHS domain-containing (seleno)protein [Planctomycetota bacterium]